jgi:hypothetical protein
MSPARNLVYFVLIKRISKPKLFISNHDLRKEGNEEERRREQRKRIVGRAVELQILLLRAGHEVTGRHFLHAQELSPRL